MRNRHVLYDIWVADPAPLERVAPLEALLTRAAQAGGATILHSYFHPFAPCGVTGFLLLAESHLSVHTWPEDGFAAFDIFSCGDMDTDAIVQVIRDALQPARERYQLIPRGILGESGPACPV
ncbi:MAG TPA: adenosylmethionine decarboxylase [Chloroflexia bacterium]|nr:adenosylmethionine decarboxylase [Chloroflexia bacterium]